MQQWLFSAGDTSKTIDVFLPDSSSTTGAGLAGLVFNTSGLKCYYRKGATGSATAVTLATQTVGGAYSSGGFVEIDATNMKGAYRFDIPDTVLASAGASTLYFYGATNLAPTMVVVQISAPVNVATINNVSTSSVTTVNANVGTTQPINFTGTGASALAKSDVTDYLGSAAPALQGGRFDVSVGAYQTGQTPLQPTVAGRTLDVSTGGEAGLDWANVGSPTTAVGLTNTTISTTQAVASVSGAVGSVTGNVGGNVAGSVASVTAVSTGAITRASFAADTGLQTIRSNTAQAGGATSITLDAGASASDNEYNNDLIYLTGGTGAGQSRFITAYVGATKVATVAAWVTNPDATTTFAIIPFDAIAGASAPTAAQNATAVWQALLAGADFGTAGSIGALLKLDIDAALSSLAPAATALSTAQWTNTLATNLGTLAGHDPGATLAKAGDAMTLTSAYDFAKGTVAMTQSYAADGSQPTAVEILYMIWSLLAERSITGTTLTAKKLDGSTTSMTFTLNDATSPTSQTRAT